MSKIAVLGFGVVGSGTVEVFYNNKDGICQKSGKELDIKYILDLRDFPDSPYADRLVKDFDIILNDIEIEIVAECMGGINPAYQFTKSLLQKGKSVVTSNKELVAAKGVELLAIAKANNCNYMFEASVGGGIPIIRPLHQCLAANKITEIAGILNGTTNFILTKMIKEQMNFYDALALAQKLGYAEKDPTADIEGHDACRKICILASLAFGKHVYPERVHTSGISRISIEDVEYADSINCSIKLIGSVKALENGKILPIVSAAFVSRECPMANVDDVFNAILVKGDAVGDVMFYGKGAGKLPTASAVVADIIDCAKAEKTSISQGWVTSEDYGFIESYKLAKTAMYIRITSDTMPKTKEKIKELFGGISFLEKKKAAENEAAFITPVMIEKEIDACISALELDGANVI
ncbi:MAG: homoserine dehydrogenase [Oscillospiraceae bacterium]|jgi:homoserine dehydrogenase